MLIAQYRGRSWMSKAIRFITRSHYSHSAFLFDENTEAAAAKLERNGFDFGGLGNLHAGAVFEAWDCGVRSCPHIGYEHDLNTPVDVFRLVKPLTLSEEQTLLMSLVPEVGVPYGFRNVLRFISKRPGNLDKTWFCSELVFEKLAGVGRTLLDRTQPWEVPPDWISRSPLLAFSETKVT